MVTIETNQGPITGKLLDLNPEISSQKCANFNNIPFASAKRFERSVPYGKWEGTRDGTVLTPECPQNNVMFEQFEMFMAGTTGVPEGNIEKSKTVETIEETLHLSVYTPENFETSGKKPVMVWIHGGGLMMGSAWEYDMRTLSNAEDVVVVVLSYRLGVFGFCFGNFGFFDQVEGLKWVRDNIEIYGGNKDNVTIFGESAGGWSVDALMVSKHAVGLFHRAIAQSGSLKASTIKDTPEDLERILGVLKTHFKVETTVELKNFMTNASVPDLLAAVKELEKLALGFGANTSMDDFFDKSLRETHKCYSKVPYMTGMNSSEIGSILFTFLSMMVPGLADGISQEQMVEMYKNLAPMTGKNPEKAEKLVENIVKTYSGLVDMNDKIAFTKMHCLYAGDETFLGWFDRAESVCSEQPVFIYNLSVRTKMFHEEPYKNGAEKVRPSFCDADHGDDLMYIQGAPHYPEGLWEINPSRYFSKEEKALSIRMMKCWSDFARTGNPGFPAFDADTKIIKDFNTPADSFKSGNDEGIQKRIAFWREEYYGVRTKF